MIVDTVTCKLSKEYKKIGTELILSENKISEICHLAKSNKRTNLSRKLLVFNIAIIGLILLSLPISVYGAYHVSKVIYEKVKETSYTDEEIELLDLELKKQGFSEDTIRELNELKTNINGQTYGPDALGADLIEVIYDTNKTGYLLREEYEAAISINEIKEVDNQTGTIYLNVYDQEGESIIGVFVLNK